MKVVLKIFIFGIFIFASIQNGLAFQDQNVLVDRMRQHENNILRTYLEYQKLYYEDKARLHELKAFEDLLTVYIDQVREIYETLNLSGKNVQITRDIAACALIFKALRYLEKAPLITEYYEKACYEFYEALRIYEGTMEQPVIYKDMQKEI